MRECQICYTPIDSHLLCATCSWWAALTAEEQAAELAVMDQHTASTEGH